MEEKMWTENKKAISEVNQILKQLNETSFHKIPKKLLDEIEKNATVNVDYIKPEIALEDLDLEEETKEMLAVISYNYFCDEEERESWNKELRENEQKYQEELRKKYNPDNLFQHTNDEIEENVNHQEIVEQKAMLEYKEPFFRKVWNFIKKYLRIN